MQRQMTKIDVKKYESEIEWTISNLQWDEWEIEDFLISEEFKIKEIDFSW
jgi:hypothetical protein